MEILRNGIQWQRWPFFLLLVCAVLAYGKLDTPGYTREFISKIDHDCRDFKGVMNKCHVWKDLGFCFKYRREMQHVCNRTCQYCVPGQKQWQVIDRAWGRVMEPVTEPVSAHALAPAVQHKEAAIQILGKERAPQVDDAASAIATQLEKGVDHDVSASQNVLGRLPEHHTGFGNTALAPTYTKSANENDETKGKLLTSHPASSELDYNQGAQTIPNQASISGKTQVSESSKEGHPVVILMGYELGEKSSKKVHEVLKNSDSKQVSDLRSGDAVGSQRVFADDRLALRGNRTSNVSDIPGHAATKNISPENIVPNSELKEIAELLDNAASTRRHSFRNKQHMHEGKKGLSVDANILHSKLHAAALYNHAMSAVQNKATQKEKIRSQADAILPVSSDDVVNQQAFQRMTSLSSHFRHKDNDMHDKTDPSMANVSLKRNSSEGMQLTDLSRTMAGNQYQSVNDPSLQMNPPLHKPALSGSPSRQVTLTVNAKPGTGEAIFKVKTSPHASGIRYTTEETPGEFPSPNYILKNENEEERVKSEEEETKIREATQAIKNVMKLFDSGNRHGHTKLVTQAAQDFSPHSKSLKTNRELAGIQNEIDAQAQSQDLAAARAQAQAQIGNELSPNGLGTSVSSVPNYAVISTKDSKEWKNLAHMLATQLRSVLNHMEDREQENRYQKEKIEEEMMMMARQRQMMDRDDDEDPYNDDDDDDGEMGNREKRRHFVLSPHLKKSSENKSNNISLKDKALRPLISGNITEQKLLKSAVKKLSRLEVLHKSHGQLVVQG